MEMIAMLGGLGSSMLAPLTSDKARAAMAAIDGSKDVGAVNAVLDALPQMGLAQAELVSIQAAAVAKREALFTPLYKKPGFLLIVGVGVAAWIMRDRIKGMFAR